MEMHLLHVAAAAQENWRSITGSKTTTLEIYSTGEHENYHSIEAVT
jgi:hypothetical protein